uniref:G-protein coupled receptors family 2 profile 1 domain-containing protein n=1 Tax=Hucho hucho TaxID=62062 RepID=A0A4W5L7Z7_9TELE
QVFIGECSFVYCVWLCVAGGAGLYCNRTWDGWLCWDDTPAGTVTWQNCPNYFPDFDSTELALNLKYS